MASANRRRTPRLARVIASPRRAATSTGPVIPAKPSRVARTTARRATATVSATPRSSLTYPADCSYTCNYNGTCDFFEDIFSYPKDCTGSECNNDKHCDPNENGGELPGRLQPRQVQSGRDLGRRRDRGNVLRLFDFLRGWGLRKRGDRDELPERLLPALLQPRRQVRCGREPPRAAPSDCTTAACNQGNGQYGPGETLTNCPNDCARRATRTASATPGKIRQNCPNKSTRHPLATTTSSCESCGVEGLRAPTACLPAITTGSATRPRTR